MRTKLDPHVFYRAAWLIDSGFETYCCLAICQACEDMFATTTNYPAYQEHFRDLYCEDSDARGNSHLGSWFFNEPLWCKAQDHRVMTLLLAGQILDKPDRWARLRDFYSKLLLARRLR